VVTYRPPADEASSHEGMQEADPPIIAERSGASAVADPEPLPSDVSPRRLRRGLVRLGGLVTMAVVVVTLAPGVGQLRSRFAHARPVWIVIACAFEVLSVLAYVPAFRAIFFTRMSWATSYKIAVAEEGAGSLFPLGGAGSLALGVWALRTNSGKLTRSCSSDWWGSWSSTCWFSGRASGRWEPRQSWPSSGWPT
jgi:hypothetical protein